ncbi:MAG: threonine synthase [Nocardioidaceae bacterium]
MSVASLTCVACGTSYPPGSMTDVCPNHPGLEGILTVEYDWSADIRDGRVPLTSSVDTLRHYARMLPLAPSSLDRLPSGWLTRTPLIDAPVLANRFGLASLAIKDEGRNPTGSLKDRSSTLAALHALEQGRDELCCASTGNAASSLAGICANLGLTAHIFVPEGTPTAKLDQLRMFGAHVMVIRGSYDDAYYLCRDAAQKFGWYDRNCATNPYLVEGKKTCGLELAEQTAAQPVDWVSVAIGDGCTVTAIHKGLAEMTRLGMLPKVPRLLGIQPAGAGPIATAFAEGSTEIRPVQAQSLADSISVGRPRNAVRAIDAVRHSGGAMLTVTDEEMLEWREQLANASGVFAEAGAAAGVAGLAKAIEQGIIGAGDRVVHIATGTGLKDAGRIHAEASDLTHVEATMDSVRAALRAAPAGTR